MHPSRTPRRAQRGAAALIVVLGLLFAMVLVTLFVHRGLVFEQRSAANQARSTIAFEAAEAGLEWALAQLAANRRIGADCAPAADPAAGSFRARYLATERATGMLTPLTWRDRGTAAALAPTCLRNANGWSCSCPADGPATLAAPTGSAAAPAFTLRFMPGAKAGLVRVIATGCSHLAAPCLPGAATRADASATVEAVFGAVGGLRTPPAASITLRGAFEAGGVAIGLHDNDPATALAVNAGGPIDAAEARLTMPAGAPTADAFAGRDAALAALEPERFFARYFGLDKAHWQRQPAVTRIRCEGDCGAALLAAIAASPDAALIQVDDDLNLAGPIALGTLERPVAIVVAGNAQLDGAVALHGLLYANRVGWHDTAAGGAFVRGAVLAESDYRGDGAPELFYDRNVLDLLRHASCGFARVHGSWRDF